MGAQALLLPALIALGVVAFYVEWAARDKQESQRFLRLLAGGGIVAGVAFVAVPWPPWYWGVDEWEAVVAMSVVAVTGALAVDYLAKPEESRAPAAILLFLVVALFVATTSYARGYARPSVHPVAVVRADEETGISGIYVGETDDGVWIGEVKQTGLNHGDKKKGDIIELPRSQVRGVAIGSLRSLDDAVAEGPKLLDSLKSCLATPPTCKAPR